MAKLNTYKEKYQNLQEVVRKKDQTIAELKAEKTTLESQNGQLTNNCNELGDKIQALEPPKIWQFLYYCLTNAVVILIVYYSACNNGAAASVISLILLLIAAFGDIAIRRSLTRHEFFRAAIAVGTNAVPILATAILLFYQGKMDTLLKFVQDNFQIFFMIVAVTVADVAILAVILLLAYVIHKGMESIKKKATSAIS